MTEKKSDAYDRVSLDGHTVNKRTLAAFRTAEARLKGDDDWTVFQGSYNSGVGPSAGTHDGGGAIDVSPFNWKARTRALRAVGFCAWHRPELPGVWGEHIHAILRGDREMSLAAHEQVVQYDQHTDGLAGHGPDLFPYHPENVSFDYPAYVRERNQTQARAQRARKAVANAIKSLQVARKNSDAKARKAQIQRFIESLRDKH
jgi:hypothetical protein